MWVKNGTSCRNRNVAVRRANPPPLPLLPPSYRFQFFLDFPVHAALCTKGMRAATPSQRRRHPAGLRAGVDSAQRVHHSVVTGVGRKLESMHKFTESAHPQHNYALARAQRPAKMRPRAARPRAPQALAFSFFFSKIDKSSEEGWEDKKTASVLRSAACTADRRFNDRLPRLFSYCLPP